MPTPVISFFVGCYNEEENIADTLDTLLRAIEKTKIAAEIIVVDDASKDQTVQKTNEWIAAHPGFPIILHVSEKNHGWATNYVEGVYLASGEYYRAVCADNVEPQETFETVIAQIGKADVVLFYYKTGLMGRSWQRKLISRFYTFLVNVLSGHHVRYYNAMPLIKRRLVMRWHSNSHGFGYQADLVTRLLDKGMTYIEVPVKGVERVKGTSKALTLRNFLSVAHTLLDIFIRRIAKIQRGYN